MEELEARIVLSPATEPRPAPPGMDAVPAAPAAAAQVDWTVTLGGADHDLVRGAAADPDGNVIIVGATWSDGWVAGGFDPSYNGNWDGFALKLDPGGRVIWSTYLGGADADVAYAVTADAEGNVYVAGATDSPGWAGGGFDGDYNLNGDGFVAKLSPAGQPLWSTYLGGSGDDAVQAVALGPGGAVYAAGNTGAAGWTSGGGDAYHGGAHDGFVVRLTPQGQLVWSACVGGTGDDRAAAVAAWQGTGQGGVVVAGQTTSEGWAAGGWDAAYGGGSGDGFVAALTEGGQPTWSTYVGGADLDRAAGVAIEPVSGDVLVAGSTRSAGWIFGGADAALGGREDGFLVRLSAAGQHTWSTYVGGEGVDRGAAVVAGPGGRAAVTGWTYAGGWAGGGGFGATFGGGSDAFIAVFDAAGGVAWSGYAGGAGDEYAYAVTGAGGRLRLAGDVLPGPAGATDALVVGLTADADPPRVLSFEFADAACSKVTVRFSEDVSPGLEAGDLALLNLTTGAVVPAGQSALACDPRSFTAVWTFPGLPGGSGRLADGDYRATLAAAGVRDAAGNLLDGNDDGSAGGDFAGGFFCLAGDVDRDRTVGFSDLLLVAQNYAKAGVGYGGGDLDGDGVVGFADLLLVAQKYGATLPAPTTPAAAAAPAIAAAATASSAPAASGVAPPSIVQPAAPVPGPSAGRPATSRRPTATATIDRRPAGAPSRKPIPDRRPATGRPAATALPPPAFGTRRLRREAGDVWA